MVHLIRHTRPAIPPGVCYGQLDVPLSSAAAIELEAAVAASPRVDVVYSSPLSRCAVLAVAVGARHAARVVFDARLMEISFGAWEGRAWDEVPRACLEAWAADTLNYRPGGGESLAELRTRVDAFAREVVLESSRGARPDVLIVSHQGPLRVLEAIGRGAGLEQFFTTSFDHGATGLRPWLTRC